MISSIWISMRFRPKALGENEMRAKSSGQSLTETVLLTAFVSLGAGATLAVCHERVAHFIELIISMIACPAP